ncbi:MAG: hypothetical protein LH473_00670, partial [Chitinophagales bacterium]|nr:hypothetical protein [Chitinophagales bacterium]
IELKKNKNGFQVTIKKYFSPYLFSKLEEFKMKKTKKAQRKNEGEHQFNFNSLSEHGLELIEAIQFDTTLRKDGVWVSDLGLEDKAGIKEKIRGEYQLHTDQFKMKIRNIAGDEIIINSRAIK